jgi:hypothetical protein
MDWREMRLTAIVRLGRTGVNGSALTSLARRLQAGGVCAEHCDGDSQGCGSLDDPGAVIVGRNGHAWVRAVVVE